MNPKYQPFLDFLKQHEECVLATVHANGAPQAATVGFSENEKLQLVFGTFSASRKFANLQHDQRVAVVVGFRGDITLQYEGRVRQLAGDELEERLQAHFVKLPGAVRYKSEPGQVYFSIEPTWVRLINYSVHPWDIKELRF
jgi:pyridoxine/pyridoxamine 5'-phosphate oxidase